MIVVHDVRGCVRAAEALWRRTVRRIPRNPALDRFLHVRRSEQLRPEVFAQMLGLRVFGARAISEQKSFVQLLVDEVLVDRLGTLGASNWIDDDVVTKLLETDEIGNDLLDDAKLLPGPKPTADAHETIS